LKGRVLLGAFAALAVTGEHSLATDISILNPLKEVDRALWPATFPLRASNQRCTSTALGDRVVITAAHCVLDKGRVSLELISGAPLLATCYRHPAYQDTVATGDPKRPEKISADFALCLTDSAVPAQTFESIDAIAGDVKTNAQIIILGFGCTNASNWNVFDQGLFYGHATIQALPEGSSYTAQVSGGSAACYGDSGGSAYVSRSPDDTHRAVVAVAATGDIIIHSSLALTTLPGFTDWANSWAHTYNVSICGVTPLANNCRVST
jgi:hypothetical protein